jgi:hypothetical protein
MERCILHGNCQAEPLLALLNLSPAFRRFWSARIYTNYIKEEIPDSDLEHCALFLYQRLGAEWGDLASEALKSRLPQRARAVNIPNMFFQGYWPFWTRDSSMDFGDSLLDRLIDSGAGKPAVLKIYYYGAINKFADIEGIAAASIGLEREKEERGPVRTVPLLEEFWKTEALYYTCNHPGLRLLAHVADSILGLLELPLLPKRDYAGFTPEYADFELPIHPHVAAGLDLGFIEYPEAHRFNIFGRGLTFLQYISRYIDCRRQGYTDGFLGYLQLV